MNIFYDDDANIEIIQKLKVSQTFEDQQPVELPCI